MAAEAAALANLLHGASSVTQQIGSGWYKASAATTSFPLRLAVLKQQYNCWTSLVQRSGINEDPSITAVLEEASKLLAQEEAKFNEVQSSCCCLRYGKQLLFPDSVTASIEDVISAFENTTKQLERASTLSQGARLLPFGPDSKYVEFKTTATAVRTALESETNGRVVTIFGGPGEGKTSMARHLALLYQNISAVENQPEIVHDEALPSLEFASKRFEDGVHFLSCGRSADGKDLLGNLWQILGYPLLSSTMEANQDQATSSNQSPQFMQFEYILQMELTKRLSSKKVLIVLDDVWESTLIQKFTGVQGKWIKFLITTREPNIYADASCEQIPITSPTSEEACRILRNHVGEFPEGIPASIKAEMNTIVEKSGRNPLILANVAARLQRTKDDIEKWKSTRRYLDEELLRDDDKVRPILFGRSYSKRTMRASTTLALESFSAQQQTLLLLASMFVSQPVPEVVFKILFKRIHCSLANFYMCYEHLHSNNFIQVDSRTISNGAHKRNWSIHPMRQKLIESIKEEELSSMFVKLLEPGTPGDIVVILLVLYGQLEWRDKAASKLETQTNHLPSSLNPIKEFVWLLQVDGEEEWEEKAFQMAKQVLHNYLELGDLDDDSLSILVGMQHHVLSLTYEAVTKFITSIDRPINCLPKTLHKLFDSLEHTSIDNCCHLNTVTKIFSIFSLNDQLRLEIGMFPGGIDKLVALLAKNQSPNIQETAALALGNIAFDVVENSVKIGLVPGAIDQLVALLAKDQSPDIQDMAAFALGSIASVVENRVKIGLVPGAIDQLVALLAKDQSPDIQKKAALALGNIAHNVVENSVKIGLVPGAIDQLVALLAKDQSPNIQEMAALALGNIAFDVVENSVKIGLVPGAIDQLVALLAKDQSPDIQDMAAFALGSIASVVENRVKIGLVPGAIDQLVALLAKDQSPDIQKKAASALGNIAYNVVENSVKIGLVPGAIDQLVALLAKDQSPDIQKKAALALGNIAYNVVENSVKIGLVPGAIDQLVALLAKDQSPNIQERAALALGNIASNVVENRVKIGLVPSAIDQLVALLAKDQSPNIQEMAALALGNIVSKVVENSVKIGLVPGAIDQLVALLAKDQSPDIQKKAALALGNIAYNVVENSVKIGLVPGAIDQLVALLAKDQSPDIQDMAAFALGSIASDVVENRVKIGLVPGAIDQLVALLAKDQSPNIQETATLALGNIASDVVENSVKIGLVPGAIDQLVALLAKDQSPDIQERAALALGNIAYNVVENSVKIGLVPGAIDQLVALLAKDQSPNIQEMAAFALGSIASDVVENSVKIGLVPGAIDQLVALLAKDQSPNIQEMAAFALGSIASDVVENSVKIGLVPGAMDQLVALLAKNENPDIQERAALALSNIRQHCN